MGRDLSSFEADPHFNLLRWVRFGFWLFTQILIFRSPFLPSILRPMMLRLFGAKIGDGVLIRRGVRIHFPWNLEIGSNSWIGEEVWIINHETVTIGSNVCISQRSIICSSGHNYKTATLDYLHKPVKINNGVWICFDAKILPGIEIGECSVVSAGEVVRSSLPDYALLVGGKVRRINPPK